MNEAPDYSAAYVILDADCGLLGHGMTCTIGRGTEIVRLTPCLWDGWWMGEPTNPDDILGHVRIARAVAPVREGHVAYCGLRGHGMTLTACRSRRGEYVIRDGRYVAPDAPGYSIEMHPESLEEYAFPGGRAWS